MTSVESRNDSFVKIWGVLVGVGRCARPAL